MIDAIVAFVKEHEAWAPPIVFVLSFGESLAFISLLVPATVILFGVGALIGETGMAFWPLMVAAALGAALGDWLSFWLGSRFGHQIATLWPLSRTPELIPRGQRFFERWGLAGVFIGRFFGPLRASIPLVAGICEMPWLSFQIANAGSAIVWAAGILAPGAFGIEWIKQWFS